MATEPNADLDSALRMIGRKQLELERLNSDIADLAQQRDEWQKRAGELQVFIVNAAKSGKPLRLEVDGVAVDCTEPPAEPERETDILSMLVASDPGPEDVPIGLVTAESATPEVRVPCDG